MLPMVGLGSAGAFQPALRVLGIIGDHHPGLVLGGSLLRAHSRVLTVGSEPVEAQRTLLPDFPGAAADSASAGYREAILEGR